MKNNSKNSKRYKNKTMSKYLYKSIYFYYLLFCCKICIKRSMLHYNTAVCYEYDLYLYNHFECVSHNISMKLKDNRLLDIYFCTIVDSNVN